MGGGGTYSLFNGPDHSLQLVLILALIGLIIGFLIWAMRGSRDDRDGERRAQQQRLIDQAIDKNRNLDK